MSSSPSTILVIDDEARVREAIADILDIMEIETLTASNGRKGIDAYKANAEEISVILLDMHMPDMNGLEVLAEIRTLDDTINIILSSGHDISDLQGHVVPHPHTHFLSKPYRLDDLMSKIEEISAL